LTPGYDDSATASAGRDKGETEATRAFFKSEGEVQTKRINWINEALKRM
jgi:hypothetical protein